MCGGRPTERLALAQKNLVRIRRGTHARRYRGLPSPRMDMPRPYVRGSRHAAQGAAADPGWLLSRAPREDRTPAGAVRHTGSVDGSNGCSPPVRSHARTSRPHGSRQTAVLNRSTSRPQVPVQPGIGQSRFGCSPFSCTTTRSIVSAICSGASSPDWAARLRQNSRQITARGSPCL